MGITLNQDVHNTQKSLVKGPVLTLDTRFLTSAAPKS